MLTKSQKLDLVDILCRMITKEVPVSLEERIWMNKLVRNNSTAKYATMILNKKARLLFITDHLLHVGDLIEGNEFEHYLRDALTTMQYEVKRQLSLEEDKHERTTN